MVQSDGRRRSSIVATRYWTNAVVAQVANLERAITNLRAASPEALQGYYRLCEASADPLVAPLESEYAGFDIATERELEACLAACRGVQSALHFLGWASLRTLRDLEPSHPTCRADRPNGPAH